MTTEQRFTVVDALAIAVPAVCPDASVATKVAGAAAADTHVVASYSQEFDALWRLGDDGPLPRWLRAAGGRPRTVVVVWDCTPAAGETTIAVGDYLTPFDWLVALSLAARRWAGVSRLPLRIHVLDLASHDHTGAFAVQNLGLLTTALPWVAVYQPVRTDRVNWAVAAPDNAEDLALLRPGWPEEQFGLGELLADLQTAGRLLDFDAAAEPSCRRCARPNACAACG